MTPLTAADPETRSADLVAENVARLKTLFPEAWTEGGLDFAVLRELLGGAVDEREEKYGLNWHGKRRARQMALTPSTGTLRPAPAESVDWDKTGNLLIEGDNLEVLKLLQRSYAGKVKLIYIDPPYNTGNDFVYPDDYRDNLQNYLERTGQTDGEGRKNASNPEASGRFHTDWLNMMYPRLKLARNLLREDGVMFVSVDDHEVDNLRKACVEIFGEENFLANICWERADSPRMDADYFSTKHDYIVGFSRNLESFLILRKPYEGSNVPEHFNRTDASGRQYYLKPLRAMGGQGETRAARPNLYYSLTAPDGIEVFPKLESGGDGAWRWSRGKYLAEIARIEWVKTEKSWTPYYRIYADESAGKPPETIWFSEDVGSTRTATAEVKALFDDTKCFDTPKPVALIKQLISITAATGDLILDFFAGSGTTAHAVMDLNAQDSGNRRFILVQLPEPTGRGDYPTIADITKERVRRAGRKLREAHPLFAGDLGFRVFKLASSNLRAWEPDRDHLAQTLEAAVEHLKTDRSEADILCELLLKLGLELTVPIETRAVAGQTAYAIGAGALLVCLAARIGPAEVEPLAHGLAAWRAELAPAGDTQAVFRDSAFADDVAKVNLTEILKQHGIANVRSL